VRVGGAVGTEKEITREREGGSVVINASSSVAMGVGSGLLVADGSTEGGEEGFVGSGLLVVGGSTEGDEEGFAVSGLLDGLGDGDEEGFAVSGLLTIDGLTDGDKEGCFVGSGILAVDGLTDGDEEGFGWLFLVDGLLIIIFFVVPCFFFDLFLVFGEFQS